ncbi:MAG: T9SS type A sorting domain-containing protein [Bacteroidota bacterium]
MQRILLLFLILNLFLFEALQAQTCRNVSVELSATIQLSPPGITLNWLQDTTATQYMVYRKLKTANSWGSALLSLAGTSTQYADTTVLPATSYEYRIYKSGTGYVGYGYINAGIEIPAMEFRGRMVLLVDSSLVDSLSNELLRLQSDLEGDGWQVIRHNVSRTASVTDVKALIVTDYNQNPSKTKAVFMLGHVPVPYSGNINPDGHTDHKGAWPADTYYAEMNSNWTDNSVNNATASDPRNANIPGDGKFDQSTLPSDVELQSGRVDFANMPAFAETEIQLLKNYLNKDHDYRHKVFTAEHKAVIDDNFGYFSGEAFAASGWKNCAPLVGATNVVAGDYFTTLGASSCLWSYGCGGGTYTSAGGIGNTTDFAADSLRGVFSMMFGSYFGDWDKQNNFLRAAIAHGTTLTNVWSGRPHWVFHHMALGENIGYDVRLSQNNTTLYFSNYAGRYVNNALMGDPSLRNDVLAPASNLVATTIGTNCLLNWTPSPDSIQGYYIYMKNDSMPEYVRRNQNLVTTNTYTDSCLLFPGTYTYMVRAIARTNSPSGTYYNLSQGITDTAWNSNNLAVTAYATYVLQHNVITFTNVSTNATNYLWIFGDGTTSTQVNPVHTYLDGQYPLSLIATNGCDSDTLNFFVWIATGINEPTNTTNVHVFPNPSSGDYIITGDIGNFYEINIYNICGEVVFQSNQEKLPYELNLTPLKPGSYILKLKNKHHTHFQTLILTH